ncbi:MAG: 50S ribosomal protein L5 [Chloroflexi bacterium]|nr:50S ribosomal protein L5 [Chloroflexota bacterium]
MAEARTRRNADGAAQAGERKAGQTDGGQNGHVDERVPPRLKQRYLDEIRPALVNEFGYGNVLQAPRMEKIVVNIGIGEAKDNSKALDAATGDLTAITGQKPIVKKSKKNIAQFRLRVGSPVGLTVTLRGNRMYEFLDRLCNAALPRLRDFQGVPTRSFDGRGNYSLGLREQLVFPEIDYDKIDKLRGLEITMVTSARTDQEGRRLLELIGVPFSRS